MLAVMTELQQNEDEVEAKSKEIEDLVAEHPRIVEVVEDEWRGEVEEARGQVEELKDASYFFVALFLPCLPSLFQALAEREVESKDLRVNISELEKNTDLLDAEIEAALAHIYHLEDENDRVKVKGEKMREETAESERLEALIAAERAVLLSWVLEPGRSFSDSCIGIDCRSSALITLKQQRP